MAHVEPLREDDPGTVAAYRLLGRLGSGGQRTVFLGEAPDGRRVAVKVLHDGARFDDRLAKEIAAAGQVAPFCIAQVLDASPGRPAYIVTEYVEGPSLQQAGRHTGADPQRLAVATATALAAIHRAGVVHRDFKPANVLLGRDGPRVIDFGIAHAMDDALTATSRTRTSTPPSSRPTTTPPTTAAPTTTRPRTTKPAPTAEGGVTSVAFSVEGIRVGDCWRSDTNLYAKVTATGSYSYRWLLNGRNQGRQAGGPSSKPLLPSIAWDRSGGTHRVVFQVVSPTSSQKSITMKICEPGKGWGYPYEDEDS